MKRALLSVLIFSFALSSLQAQTAHDGPIIEGYGDVFDIPNADFTADPERNYMVVFDVAESPGGPSESNILLNTVARFLNMHARAGVPAENMKVACVLHGGAAKDALTEEAYHSNFDTENPNIELLEKLRAAGVRIFLCGQSAANRGYDQSEIAEPVQIALSAMTVLVTLQGEGYAVVN